MMANSGARGSFKQIRQLAGMRGLMANPKGEIIERPIKANFMEGLTVLEYFISTHGARKGLADTALRTADSGYLTRRLVDVAQDVIIREPDCGTEEYIELPGPQRQGEPNDNLVGRIAADEIATKRGRVLVEKGARDRPRRAGRDRRGRRQPRGRRPGRRSARCSSARRPPACARPATGARWPPASTAQIGDAVGIIAAQSIGEPGTQLTMRTFHTGGVAGADITHGLPRVVELFEARKPKGLAQIAEHDGMVGDRGDRQGASPSSSPTTPARSTAYTFPRRTRLLVERREGRGGRASSTRARCTRTTCSTLRGRTETEQYLVKEVQEVYKSQGVDINDKHIELIVRQMLKKVRVDQKGDTGYLPGRSSSTATTSRARTPKVKKAKGETAQFEEIILGITKASLNTDSFLSAASFQETTKVLTDAALEGKKDRLNGLKENVIIGKLIPAATGLKRYRRIEIEPAEPLPRAMDDVGLLDHDELAAELGLGDGDGLGRLRRRLRGGPRRRSRRSAPAGGDTGFAEELAELDVPTPSGEDEQS